MWISVADPGCLSWIPDPDFYPSRVPDPLSWILDPGTWISDPGAHISWILEPGSQILDPVSQILVPGSQILELGSQIPDPRSRIPGSRRATKKEGENFFPTFFVVTNIAKLKLNFCELAKKKFVPIYKEL